MIFISEQEWVKFSLAGGFTASFLSGWKCKPSTHCMATRIAKLVLSTVEMNQMREYFLANCLTNLLFQNHQCMTQSILTLLAIIIIREPGLQQ